ncbi:hypothetical protein C1H46_000479 [Malus baccata]|uniref:Uncharacterized protein n=1 Tax=Malus baccata TaxID=106549 RepID=A0A540NS28_MALBA|nr:hypothetical protein C1H46_000479 [Malus baccata]
MGGALQLQAAAFLFWVLLCGSIAAAQNEEEWKTATATYSNESDGSIITVIQALLSRKFKYLTLLDWLEIPL